MSEYDAVKRSKLLLKGEKDGSKRKKKHKSDKSNNKKAKKVEEDQDVPNHGGWCKAEIVSEITGSVGIEFGNQTYVKALDNGTFSLGIPHAKGEAPFPEEILTAITLSDTKVAFKSGYGKYVGYDKNGAVTGRSDAIGPLEHWEPIFQDGKLALLASNGCFMSVRESDDMLVVLNRKASDGEMVQVRYQAAVKERDPLEGVPMEERGTTSQIEENYVRKFQKFQDKKLKMSTEDKKKVELAKRQGDLHETLLDRRSKMKSDRYCK